MSPIDAAPSSETISPTESGTQVLGPLTDLAKWGGRGDKHLVLAPTAVEIVRRPSLSPSTASSMHECSASWAIDHLIPRSDDPFGAAELGSAGHRVLELLFDSERPATERSKETAIALTKSLHLDTEGKLAIPEDPSDLPRWYEEIEHRVLGLWGIEDPAEVEIVGSEIQLVDVEIGAETDDGGNVVGGVPFGGYIDRVSRRDGGVVISDYKLGKVKKPRWYGKKFVDAHGDQLRLYVMAWQVLHPEEPVVAAEVLYTTHRESVSVDISAEAMSRTLDAFKKAWAILNTHLDKGEFTTKTGPLCGWCPAVNVCPAALAAEKVYRIDSCNNGELLGIGTVSAPTTLGESDGRCSYTVEDKTQVSKETDMFELKPWEETNDSGSLNLNSYASTAVFGLVELAAEVLHEAGQPAGIKNRLRLSKAFSHIIAQAIIAQGGGEVSFQSGYHTRLRGALRTSLVLFPVPFGEGPDSWTNWAERVQEDILVTQEASTKLWESDPTKQIPWDTLALSFVDIED